MITREMEEVLKYYNLGLTAYKQQKWDEAIRSFEQALIVDPNDGPSVVYLKRSNEYKLKPPGDDWDGVKIMTTK
jgi:tetratricopeptide (TPR) repeat protein